MPNPKGWPTLGKEFPNYGESATMGDEIRRPYAAQDARAAERAERIPRATATDVPSPIQLLTERLAALGNVAVSGIHTAADGLERHSDRLFGECPDHRSDGGEQAGGPSRHSGQLGELMGVVDRLEIDVCNALERLSRATERSTTLA